MSTGAAAERTRIGTTLRGKYRLERVLGSGGVATVYAATHRNKKRFAVKMLHPELSAHQDICERFLREGYAANSVGHAGVVNVLDDDTAEDGAAFLVMELLEGSSVEQLREARGGRLGVQVVLAIAEQVLDVLAVAHAMGIVHRDIKPENLFVTHEGQLKVLDFGIARVLDLAQDAEGSSGAPVIIGTPLYMSPEQAAGLQGETEPRTDLWSVGATMFMLLTGCTVHDGDTLEQLALRAATMPAPTLATACPGAPRGLVAVVDKALAFNKDDRWSSAWEMRDEVWTLRTKLFGEVPVAQILKTALPVAASDLPPSSKEMTTLPAGLAIPGPPRVPQMEAAPVAAQVPPPQPSAPVVTTLDPSASPPKPLATARASRLTSMKRAAGMVAVGLALGIAVVATTRAPTHSQAPSVAAATPVAPPAPVVVDPPTWTTPEPPASTAPEVATEDQPRTPKPTTTITAPAKPSASPPRPTAAPTAHARPRRDDGF
jgi:serine/threonine-protein kinase